MIISKIYWICKHMFFKKHWEVNYLGLRWTYVTQIESYWIIRPMQRHSSTRTTADGAEVNQWSSSTESILTSGLQSWSMIKKLRNRKYTERHITACASFA